MQPSKSMKFFGGLAAALLLVAALGLALVLNPALAPAPLTALLPGLFPAQTPVPAPVATAPVAAPANATAQADTAAQADTTAQAGTATQADASGAAPAPAAGGHSSAAASAAASAQKYPATAPASASAPAPASSLAPGVAQAAPVPAAAAGSAWSPGAPWNFKTYHEAMRQSGRVSTLPEKDFDELQARKAAAAQAIERYLAKRFGKADPGVLQAFRELPREYFHYDYEQKRSFASNSYEALPKPWAIGYGSALSDYLGQAYMTQLCRPRPGDTVLEIGTGSGYQSALLSRMVKEVYSVEIIKPLGEGVAGIYKPLGLDNVHTRVGDGYFGWPEVQGGFDIIMVTCVARYVSPELLKQLKPEGRLIVPIGQAFKRGQVLYVFTKDKQGKVHSRKDVGVYFIPMTGKIQQDKP